MSRIREDWEGLSEDHAATFGRAVRAFEVAEEVQAAAEVELRKALQDASTFDFMQGEGRRSPRTIARDAKRLNTALIKALAVWRAATEDLRLEMDGVDGALVERPEGGLQSGLQSTLQAYQQRLRESIEAPKERMQYWAEDNDTFGDDADWTPDFIQTFKEYAKAIERDLSPAEPSSNPVAGDSRSSSKRKRQGEDDAEPSSKALRNSKNANASRSGGAKGGAERSSRPYATDQQHEQGRDEEPLDQAVAAPETSILSQDGTNDEQSNPDGAIANPPAPLPFPAIGVAGHYASILRDEPPVFEPTFMEWCRRQLINANYGTLEECEPLAEALNLFFQRTLEDHDWENEPYVPFLPLTSDDFRTGRVMPNGRRLFAMTQNAPAQLQEFCIRNLSTNDLYFTNADRTARRIIRLIREHGLYHDWETVDDLVLNKQLLEVTHKIPLEGLNGHWNVSTHMRVVPNFTRLFTDTCAVYGHYWGGRQRTCSTVLQNQCRREYLTGELPTGHVQCVS